MEIRKTSTSLYSRGALVLILILGATLAILRFNSFQVGALVDDAHYVVLAESLAGGRGYRLINFPDAPPEWAFPPGWPLLLSSAAKLFPGNYQSYKLLPVILWLASIVLMYRFFAGRIQSPYLEFLILLIALSPTTISLSVTLMSEMAYLFFSVLVLVLFDRWEQDHVNRKGTRWLMMVGIAILAVVVQLIRTVGLSMLLALIVYLLFSRRYQQAGIVILASLVGIFPQLWLNRQDGGSLISQGYQSQVFSDSILERIGHIWVNLQIYLNETIANALLPVFSPNIKSAFAGFGLGMIPTLVNALLLILIFLGFVLACRKPGLSEIYLAVYFLGILNFWNPDVGAGHRRFVIPMLPFFYFYLIQGVLWVSRRIVGDRQKLVTISMAGLVILMASVSVVRNIQNWRDPIRARMIDLSSGADWIAENTPPESIVMTWDPVPRYLYAYRRTVPYPDEAQDLDEYIKANGIDYILVSEKLDTSRTGDLGDYIETILLPALTSDPDRFSLMYKNTSQNVWVYECHGDT